MLIAAPCLRRLVASLMLAVLAVVAVAGSAHAGRHASPASHEACVHGSEVPAMPDDGASPDGKDAATGDALGCPYCCHGIPPFVSPGLAARPVLPRRGMILPTLVDLPPPTGAPEGPRRPPRLP